MKQIITIGFDIFWSERWIDLNYKDPISTLPNFPESVGLPTCTTEFLFGVDSYK